MQLTSEQFHQIISTLKSDPLSGRRGAPRVGLRLMITIIPCNEAEVTEQRAWLRDLSVSGMGFIHDRPLQVGAFLVVRFDRNTDEAIAVLVEVTRSKQVGPTSFEIGTRIERVVTREELPS
jgi:hypothetical protein